MQALLIVALSLLACIGYGMVHDQITARICVEYFTIGHAPLATEDATLLGLAWGVRATWWVGLMLGVPLAAAARIGGRPRRSARSLVRPLAVTLACTALVASAAGVAALVAGANGWIEPPARIAARLSADRHVPYVVDLWIHNASYTAGFVLGLLLMAWIWRTRIIQAQAAARSSRNDRAQDL